MRRTILAGLMLVMVTAPAMVTGYSLDNMAVAADNMTIDASKTGEPRQDAAKQAADAARQAVIAAAAAKADSEAADAKIAETLPKSVAVLVRLFVLAVILESALAVMFRWRPYIANIDTRTANPPIAFFVALILVRLFHLDEVGLLIGSYSTQAVPHSNMVEGDRWASSIITALVIAGGSAGVNKMLRALGFRAIESEIPVAKPLPTEAWIAVIDQSGAAGSRDVLLNENSAGWRQIGSIDKGRKLWPFVQWLVRDHRRFPTSGGYSIPIGVPIEVSVVPAGTAPPAAANWGPRSVAAGAIVDIAVS